MELYNFLNLENGNPKTYSFNWEQNSAIAGAREQFKNNDYLTNGQANQEIDDCLNNNQKQQYP